MVAPPRGPDTTGRLERWRAARRHHRASRAANRLPLTLTAARKHPPPRRSGRRARCWCRSRDQAETEFRRAPEPKPACRAQHAPPPTASCSPPAEDSAPGALRRAHNEGNMRPGRAADEPAAVADGPEYVGLDIVRQRSADGDGSRIHPGQARAAGYRTTNACPMLRSLMGSGQP